MQLRADELTKGALIVAVSRRYTAADQGIPRPFSFKVS
jgi:hypothetical protein